MATVVGVAPHFVRTDHSFLPLRYFAQWRETQRILRRERPDHVLVMQPPPFALAAVLRYARKHDALVIGDLHSGVFLDPKWSHFAGWVLRTLKKYGGAIVPNSDLRDWCADADVTVFVCHGLMAPLEPVPRELVSTLLPSESDEYILVPLAYAYDEPIEQLLEAARADLSVTWVLTGNAPERVRQAAPTNVVFPGYVSSEQYTALRSHASAVFALTTEESTMQSAGYEATAAATPLVTTPMRVLKDYFGEAALYTALDPVSLLESAREILSNGASWRARMQDLRRHVIDTQDEPQSEIRDWVSAEVARRRVK
ncbi:MAG: glycosyltransferase [Microbacterium gubbeenense]